MEKRSESEFVLKETNIGLVIESYEEIFSSFDPRPYDHKSLSVDFIDECKRAARDKDNQIEVRLMMPKEKRNLKQEAIIKKRLQEHFERHRTILEKEKKGIMRQGLFFIFFGIVFMLTSAYILYYYSQQSFIKELLVVVLEPGGWFLFWQGLDLIIFKSKDVSPELEFYRKMAKAEISFMNY